MPDTGFHHLSAGSGSIADSAADLRRQAAQIDALSRHLLDVVHALPRLDAGGGWWGCARDVLQGLIDIERARLGRQVERLDGVSVQLRFAADQGAVSAPLSGGSP